MRNLLLWTLRAAHRLHRRATRAQPLSALRRAVELRRDVHVGPGTILEPFSMLDTAGGGTITIGKSCHVHPYAMLLTKGADIAIGDHCSINPFAVIYGGATIGSHVRIATHCVIVPMNHVIDSRDTWIDRQGLQRKGVVIGDDVWLGTRVTVLDGVTLARGTVVAAGAVVTKSTEQYGVYAGTPARLLRHRGEHGT